MFAERFYPLWIGARLFAWGGESDIRSNPPFRAARYDPASMAWTVGESPGPTARYQPALGVIDGKAVVWGGAAYDATALYGTQIRYDGAAYDPATKTWSPITCKGSPGIDTRYAN